MPRDELSPEIAEAADRIQAFVRDILAGLPRAGADAGLNDLLPDLHGLAQPDTQAEILQRLIEAAVRHADRAALFVVRHGRASGWSAEGFAGDPVQADIREVQVDLEQETVFRDVVRSRRSVAENDDIAAGLSFLRFGQTEPLAAVYVPLNACERVVGVLYGDVVTPGRRLGRSALECLAVVASLAIERQLLRRKLGNRPMARAVRDTDPALPGSPTGPPPRMELHERPASEAPRPTADPVDEVPALSFDLPAAGALRDDARGGADGDQDARRFARLLATEIKLYHEQEVAAGRQSGDLYTRLREPIESSRKLYLERVEALHLARDYFEEEMVEVLAGGKPELLGPRP